MMTSARTTIEVGRLLRAGTQGFVAGCRVSQVDSPTFGAMVRVPLGEAEAIYGLVHDIRVDDDGLVRQLAAADGIDDTIILDNRMNRNVPIEVSVLSIGYTNHEQVYHLLPRRPPLSLDLMYLCDDADVRFFTGNRRFGYFRHVLRAADLPIGELLAAHLQQVGSVHRKYGDEEWTSRAMQEIITLLRDDYTLLMSVLGALAEIQ
jgi:hypothetical protein